MAFSGLTDVSEDLYRLTEEDIARLHDTLLSMYKDINRICAKNGIHLIASGGTALGAIRHKGFISWDDDMDLFMFREEYERFEAIFPRELGQDYYLLAPDGKQGANCFLPRVMKKGTTLWNMIDETAPYPHGIYIDINIIEYAPQNQMAARLKALRSDALRFISYSVYWKQYKSESLRRYLLKTRKTYYRLRMALGTVFSFRSAEQWFLSFDRCARGRKSPIYTVPTGRKKYYGERLTEAVVHPLKKVDFEDTQIYVFNDYDWYLRNLYGDYMVIPDVEDREYHLCLQLDFTKG